MILKSNKDWQLCSVTQVKYLYGHSMAAQDWKLENSQPVFLARANCHSETDFAEASETGRVIGL